MSTMYRDFTSGIHLVKLSGPLNAGQEEEIRQLFRDLSAQGIERVVIDLQDVPLIDSRGLATLVGGYKIFGKDARNFRLIGLQDQPKLVFELTGFDHIFQIFDNTAEAFEKESSHKLQFPRGIPVFVPQLAAVDLAA